MNGLYMRYTIERKGYEIDICRNTYRVFRELSPKTAAKMLREWADEIEKSFGDMKDVKDLK